MQLSCGTHNYGLIPASCSCYALYDSTQSSIDLKGGSNILGGKGGIGIQLIIQVHLISSSKIKFAVKQAMKVYSESRGIAVLFL
jgi:hypothetical protein